MSPILYAAQQHTIKKNTRDIEKHIYPLVITHEINANTCYNLFAINT